MSGVRHDGEVRLDWNESPIGASQLAVQRVVQAARDLHRYPGGLLEEVTALTADHLGVKSTEVLLTSGVDAAVDLALSMADRVWVVQPGFDGYLDRARIWGRPVHVMELGPDWQPAGSMQENLGRGDLVLLAQPNNPTGNLFRQEWLEAVRQRAEYTFLDETYQEFSPRPTALPDVSADPGLLVFRSFSKAMGLAGVRLGALVAHADTIAALQLSQRFLPIDAVSLHAVAGTLQDPTFVARLITYVRHERPNLVSILRDSGLFSSVRDTHTNFVLAQYRPALADAVLAGLGGEGIRVKRCESLGLPGWLRVSVGTAADHARLRACLARIAAHTMPTRT